MCIKDKIWWKRFILALLGLGLYLLDTGTDTWVGNSLIQNCHVKFGASVLCLVYVLPGVSVMIRRITAFKMRILHPEIDDDCISCISELAIGIFYVPLSILVLLRNLIKLDDEALGKAKL